MSKAKAKGTMAETLVVRFFNSFYLPEQEEKGYEWRRESSKSIADEGDVFGPYTSIEVKNRPGLGNPLHGGLLDNAEWKAGNSGRKFWALVSKPKGFGNGKIGRWPVVITLGDALKMFGAHATLEEAAALCEGKKPQSMTTVCDFGLDDGRQFTMSIIGLVAKAGVWDKTKAALEEFATQEEQVADVPLVVVRRLKASEDKTTKSVLDPGKWFAVMSLEHFAFILQRFGVLPQAAVE